MGSGPAVDSKRGCEGGRKNVPAPVIGGSFIHAGYLGSVTVLKVPTNPDTVSI